MFLPRRASEPPRSRRHRPRTCIVALVAVLGAWLLPGLHVVLADALHPPTPAAHASAHHHTGCCALGRHARGEPTERTSDNGGQRPEQDRPEPGHGPGHGPGHEHDPDGCDLCRLLALGLHRLTPTLAGSDVPEAPARVGLEAVADDVRPPVCVSSALRARGPPSA